MVKKIEVPPPIYSCKRYQIGPQRRIEELRYLKWPGTVKKKIHPEEEQVIYLGYTMIMGVAPGGQKIPREICFSIDATNIFDATLAFDAAGKSAVEEMNKPDIVAPPGIETP